MKIKMTKGMHAKRILCLGLAAAMALTSVQTAPITVEAKTVSGSVSTDTNENRDGIDLSTSKYNALEAVYTADEIKGAVKTVNQIEKVTVKATNTGKTAAKLNVKVYMKNVSAGTVSEFVQVEPEDMVYSGTVTVAAGSTNAEVTLAFPKKFELDSTKNVLFAMETELVEGDNVSIKAYGSETTEGTAIATSSKDKAIDLTRGVQVVSSDVPVGTVSGNKPNLGITAHVHSMVTMEKAAVLNKDGSITEGYAKYYVCNDAADPDTCGGIYANPEGTVSTTVDKQVFEAHKVPVKAKIEQLKDSNNKVDVTEKYVKALDDVDSATYQEFDKDKKPMTLEANIAVLDQICTDFAKAVASAEDLRVVAEYEAAVAGIADVTDTAAIVEVYDMFSAMTSTQMTLVAPDKANKISVAFALNNQVNALEKAVDKVVELSKLDPEKDKDVFKNATNVANVKNAADLKKKLDESLKEANKTYASLKLGESLTPYTDKLAYAEAVYDAIQAIDAIKTPIDLASGKQLTDARNKYVACFYRDFVYNYSRLTQAEEDYAKINTEANRKIIAFLDAVNRIADDYKVEGSDDYDVKQAKVAYGELELDQKETLQKSYGTMLTKYELFVNVQKAVDAIVLIGALEDTDTKVSEARTAVNKAGVVAHVGTKLLNDLEDNEAALAVIKQIAAIGEVTVNSKAKIDAAQTALKALEDFDKAEQEKAEKPENAGYVARERYAKVADKYVNSLKDAADTYAGLEVVALIDKIGTVDGSDACKARIDAAREAYNKLTDAQKRLVSNAAVLAQADTQYAAAAADKIAAGKVEKQIDEITTPITGKSAEKIDAAIDAYNALTEAQKALVPTAKVKLLDDEDKAVKFIVKVEAIKAVSSDVNKSDIEAAKVEYYGKAAEGETPAVPGLADSVKAVLVENPFAVIDAAIDVENKIDAIGEKTAITMETKATIKAARTAYDAYMTEEKTVQIDSDKVTALEDAEKQLFNVVVADLVKKVRAIGTVEYTTESAQKIQTAQAAFDELSLEEKATFAKQYAEEYKTFEDAVSTYNVKAAAAIDAKIAALPEASLEAEAAVTAVYSEYNTLTVEQKALVKNAKALTDKIVAIESLKAEKADKDAADAAAKVIDAIGTVDGTDATDAKIAAAQEAFYGLTDAQKKLIADKKDALDKAVQEQAKKKAELLSEAAKKEEDAKAEAAAKEAIAAIGEVTAADEATKAKITKAQIAFYGLSEELQAKLKDEKATLDAAYDKYTEIYIQNKLNEVTPVAPTETPTVAPTDVPTAAPTETPTEAPTKAPTKKPTAAPTKKPSVKAPAKVTNVKAVNQKGKKVAVSWKKLPKVAGYQVQISTSKKFTKSTTKTYEIKKYTTVKKTVTKLSLKKKYYVRVRAYNKSGKTMKYGKYSLVKSVTVKK